MQEQSIATSYATILGQMVRQLREVKNADQLDVANHLGVIKKKLINILM